MSQPATTTELLPTRRSESWRYSDLRAAFGDSMPMVGPDRKVKVARRLGAGGDAIGMLTELYGVRDDFVARADAPVFMVSRLPRRGHFVPLEATATVEPGATLTRIVIQPTTDQIMLDRFVARVGAGATFRQFVLAEGAKLARVETHVCIEGEGAEVTLNGAYLVGAGRHADLTSVIEHKAPGGVTRQLIKGVARKGGRGVFQGKIVVDRGAQKTDARQHHRGILLEDGAEIFAKPELMIHADDVQCAHGNTAGGLDESALFYMRSRGIPEAAARALLIEAFLAEAIPEGLPEELYEELISRIRTWLAGKQP